jgi:death-on-curing protein
MGRRSQEAGKVIEQPWARFVSFEEVLDIHAECIKLFGGDATPTPKDGCVEGSLGAAWNAELYSGAEDSTEGLCFAGCVLFYLVKNHCFVDGNKRVAWAACMEALRSLGLTVAATDDEAETFCLEVITGTGPVRSAVDVCLWLAPRLEAVPD